MVNTIQHYEMHVFLVINLMNRLNDLLFDNLGERFLRWEKEILTKTPMTSVFLPKTKSSLFDNKMTYSPNIRASYGPVDQSLHLKC